MNRLIDTMTNEKAHDLVEYLADVNVRVVEAIDVLENLFKPVPHWSDCLEIEQAIRILRNEVNCRIEHGADSNGHLDYVQNKLGGILKEIK